MDHNQIYSETKQELDKVSPSFCVAKWNQVTIHLGTGLTHSCHHPAAHKIPINEIRVNPSALHNTQFKKEQRKLMLMGERPKECDYCWRAEDSKQGDTVVYSDRITKSSEPWARPHINTIKDMPWDTDVTPTYLEVDFDTTCNLKCMYCSPSYSSTWRQEIERHGPYKLPSVELHSLEWLKQIGQMPIPNNQENPYVEAFWKWFPDIVSSLETFRITGGEPLLSKNTFRVLDYLIENPQPQMEFNINSNLDVPEELFEQFIQKMTIIQQNKSVKSFKVYTSNEAHGKHSEYIRFGLNYDKWLKNCHRVLNDVPDSHLTVMAAYNILSLPSFKLFMDDIIDMKWKYTVQPHRKNPVSLDVPYIRWPEFLAPWVAGKEHLRLVEDAVTHMYRNIHQMHWPPLCGKGFFDYEVNRFERLYNVIKDQMIKFEAEPELLDKQRADFYAYIVEYDKRKGTNFLETFPEYENLYKQCKESFEKCQKS